MLLLQVRGLIRLRRARFSQEGLKAFYRLAQQAIRRQLCDLQFLSTTFGRGPFLNILPPVP